MYKEAKKYYEEKRVVGDYLTKESVISMMTGFANKQVEAITVTRCCKTFKDEYAHTFEVNLNSEKRKEQYNKQIEQIHNAPCKVCFYDGKNYIELKP